VARVERTAEGTTNDPGDQAEIRLRIPAKPEYVTLCRLALTGLSRVRPLPEETLADLKLALTEACSNAVRHAYTDGEGSVEIRYLLHRDRVVIEVLDEGDGFELEEPGDSLEDLTEGGLGIAIIRAVADELEIGTREGVRGSRLRFVKRLDG
jgi:serine/threonine-protein kinase RsbW